MKRLALMIVALLSLQGCAGLQQCEEMPTLPTKPDLPSIERTIDEGIKLDKQDAGDLFEYILDLERGYK